MKLTHSGNLAAGRPSENLAALLEGIAEEQLRRWVEHIAWPRHFTAELDQNQKTAAWLSKVFTSLGLQVEQQGPCSNMIALPRAAFAEAVLVGAHYDSVPQCPGADDNASAVAALLGCAEACQRWQPDLQIVYVAFNREEDGLLGSRDFVESYLPAAPFRVRCAHILEMVGYTSSASQAQRLPTGLPISIGEKGDFLGLLANSHSGAEMLQALRQARTYVARLPVTGLEVEKGAEKLLPVLARSDHVPFWGRDIPTVMWTDTAEFRNPHYHLATDTPETLDYPFLRQVTQVLTATAIAQAEVR